MTALDGKALLDHGKAIARRYAGRVGPDLAEELRAEAVLRALASPPPDGHMEPWLERIYRNLFVDLWRRGRLASADDSDLSELAGEGTPEEEIIHRERRRVVRESLSRLPREARRALLSRYYGELDDEVAANRLGIATATVRTRIHRALARMRGRLGDLRTLCPPLLGKLGAQTAAVGLAPVMLAALVVVGSASRAPRQDLAPPSARQVVALGMNARGTHPARIEATAVLAAPESRVRVARKTTALAPATAPAAPAPPAQIIDLQGSEPIVAEILRPDGVDVLAEPPKPAAPCMVEAPANFVPQIEKMIEDRL